MSDKRKLCITNFRDFQPRKDLKSLSWFRLENTIFDDEGLHDKISSDGLILFIYLLVRAAKKNNSEIEFSESFIERKLNFKNGRVKSLIEILKENQIVHEVVTNLTEDVHYITEQDITLHNITNNTQHNGTESKDSLHPLIELWNLNAIRLSKVMKSNPTRNKKAQNIWKQSTPEELTKVVQKINASDFCSGKNDRQWKATFDWLLQPETYLKVLEGKYDNRTSTRGYSNQRPDEDFSNLSTIRTDD